MIFFCISNNITEIVPEGFVFGKPSEHDPYTVQDLIKDPNCTPCLLKRDFYKWMKNLNELRNGIKKKDSTRFTLKQFYEKISYYDKVQVMKKLN